MALAFRPAFADLKVGATKRQQPAVLQSAVARVTTKPKQVVQHSLERAARREGSGKTILALPRNLVKYPSMAARRVLTNAVAVTYRDPSYHGSFVKIVVDFITSVA